MYVSIAAREPMCVRFTVCGQPVTGLLGLGATLSRILCLYSWLSMFVCA